MGINVGAATASLICGYLGQTYGWAYGFGLAGLGMLIGLIFFVLGKPLLMGKGEPKNPEYLRQRMGGIKREFLFYAIGLAMVALCWFMVQNQSLVGILLGTFGAILVTYVLFVATFGLPYGGYSQSPAGPANAFIGAGAVLTLGMFLIALGNMTAQWIALAGGVALIAIIIQQCIARADEARDRILAAMFMIIVSIIFWALFEQAGSSLNLFTDRHVDRAGVPASMFQSINAIYIILLAPLFASIWTGLGRRGAEPSTPFKFGLGVVQVGLGFLVLVWGARSVGIDVPTPVIFIFLIYLLHTTGELCLSPVGLSAMNRLAPRQMASLIMGVWFFASATGNFAAGLIASATGAEGVGEEAGKEVVLGVYSTVGWVAVGVGIAVLVISPLIKRLMHLDTLKDDVDHAMAGQESIGEPQAAGVNTSGETR
jgi:proton-dependent oligopeptide transporter, POT family